jgi:hypothetical protein
MKMRGEAEFVAANRKGSRRRKESPVAEQQSCAGHSDDVCVADRHYEIDPLAGGNSEARLDSVDPRRVE